MSLSIRQRMKNVHILPEYWDHSFIGACGWIRLLEPLLNPLLAKDFNVGYGYSLKAFNGKPDVVIFERLWHPNEIDLPGLIVTLSSLKDRGIRIIYSIDDNLPDFPLFQKSEWYSSLCLSVINAFFHYSDLVVVSTPALKQRFESLHRNIVVIPNVIDHTGIRAASSVQKGKVKFGYLASPDNLEYLFTILEPVRTVLSRFKSTAIFEIIGNPGTNYFPGLFKGLPVRFIAPPDTAYKKYIPWLMDSCHWDFGIAPLTRNDFTRCKSDMKFLDFTRLGIPGVYSDFTPYETVKEALTGLTVMDNWVDALSCLIDDQKMRADLTGAAIEYVSADRNRNVQIAQWKEVLNNL
jgi:glycosyltransferase involved in cell wall biosynthesis